LGIPVFSAPGISDLVEEGEELEIIMDSAVIRIQNTTTGEGLSIPPLPDTMAKILESGGV
ncbi:MAG TPA: 3-isopropylmalate dehydratase, partial [Firmicutes bacterium]|nr:3-isopropylmalate dehydratase [Bacillota bacterium]